MGRSKQELHLGSGQDTWVGGTEDSSQKYSSVEVCCDGSRVAARTAAARVSEGACAPLRGSFSSCERGSPRSGRWERGLEWLTCPAAAPGDRGTRPSHDGLQQGAFCDCPACAPVSDSAAPGRRTVFPGIPLGEIKLADTPRNLCMVQLQPPGPSSVRYSRATPGRWGPAVAQPRAQPLKAPTTYL